MASAAQVLANQANAQHSTGPQTPEGKARSSQNGFQHGLTGSILTVDASEQDAYGQLQETLRKELSPTGALEEETFSQLMDGVWRLRKIRAMIQELFLECDGDPLASAAGAARLTALQRYRANAEMLLYRSTQALRELQTAELYRARHLTAEESERIPVLVNPGATMIIKDAEVGLHDRLLYYEIFGFEIFANRFDPEFLDAMRDRRKQQQTEGCDG